MKSEGVRPAKDVTVDESWVWPVAIVTGLLIVIAVNVFFAFVAVGGNDEVLSNYESGDRWGASEN